MTEDSKIFIDSNVLIYAFDDSDERKRRIANDALSQLWTDDSGSLSVQVLQEFYANITRKIHRPLTKREGSDVVDEYSEWCGTTTVKEVQEALVIERTAQISFWDALIVACAKANGATRILSEDLNHGQVIDGLEIVNPFRQ